MLKTAKSSWIPMLLIAAVLIGCSDDDPAAPGDPLSGEAAPNFALLDVNETSPTFEQGVSPRDYLQKVSAWYFGHAT
jgi:hypothetical protein